MKLLMLTRAIDGARVYVNPEMVCAVYPYYKKGTTVVQFAGGDDSYVEVSENADDVGTTIATMLQDARGGNDE